MASTSGSKHAHTGPRQLSADPGPTGRAPGRAELIPKKAWLGLGVHMKACCPPGAGRDSTREQPACTYRRWGAGAAHSLGVCALTEALFTLPERATALHPLAEGQTDKPVCAHSGPRCTTANGPRHVPPAGEAGFRRPQNTPRTHSSRGRKQSMGCRRPGRAGARAAQGFLLGDGKFKSDCGHSCTTLNMQTATELYALKGQTMVSIKCQLSCCRKRKKHLGVGPTLLPLGGAPAGTWGTGGWVGWRGRVARPQAAHVTSLSLRLRARKRSPRPFTCLTSSATDASGAWLLSQSWAARLSVGAWAGGGPSREPGQPRALTSFSALSVSHWASSLASRMASRLSCGQAARSPTPALALLQVPPGVPGGRCHLDCPSALGQGGEPGCCLQNPGSRGRSVVTGALWPGRIPVRPVPRPGG